MDSYIPTRTVLHLLEQAGKAGCDVAALLGNLDLTLEWLSQQESISAARYGELYQAIIQATENEWFGIFVGGSVPLGSFRMMCLTMLHCQTLEQAVRRAGEFAEICRGMKVKYTMSPEGDMVHFRMMPVSFISSDEFAALLEEADPSHILTSIITWLKFAEWLVNKTIPITEIRLCYPRSRMGEPMVAINSDTVKFDCDHNGFSIEASNLSLPIVQDQESMLAMLRTAPYHLVTEDMMKLRFSDRVRNILKRDVSKAMPSAELLASQLHMSATTLRRQLAKESTSYQRLKDECRMEAAFHFLSCTDFHNNDIAEKLGFDDPSAFFRSFKKWTGQTPGEYRATALCKL
ncbi:helix-turn-helix domain-containing protein [Teredinibacter waterburyi]|jgi:transcriptional regulator, AraC family|uniref:helix-turn-helix domain-containing protein n=1 Tax=Teredinibacter waterburyi TaxID=1500538 RepID=UPI00165F8831|nr:AraC family transcriptional regulator [Teredinibacter waterburyi]